MKNEFDFEDVKSWSEKEGEEKAFKIFEMKIKA